MFLRASSSSWRTCVCAFVVVVIVVVVVGGGGGGTGLVTVVVQGETQNLPQGAIPIALSQGWQLARALSEYLHAQLLSP